MHQQLPNLEKYNLGKPNLEKLSLPQLVAQMFVVRASGYLFDHQIQYPAWEPSREQLRALVADLGVGGVIFLGGSAAELSLRIQELQSWAEIPLLTAADIEEGVGQRFSGATWFPPPMALGAIDQIDSALAGNYAYQMGAITAQEAQAIGLNWLLAPVVDVNNNPDNPVINVRAFGEDVATVTRLTQAFIRGCQNSPVLTTAKHFPGHGDTAVDSHLELPVLSHSPERLESLELVPFRGAIEAGVDSIMSAHLLIPSWDAQYPATLSPGILTGKLRQELGFEGLIVTDALIMGGIANTYGAKEAPVLAVEAGADILLMPVDPAGAIAALVAAVETGRISLERIHQSVERIWQAKQKIFSVVTPKSVTPKPEVNLALYLAQPQSLAIAEEIIRKSLVVHGNLSRSCDKNHKTSPQNNLAFRNLLYTDEAIDCDFLSRQAPAITIPKSLNYQLQIIDNYSGYIPDLEGTSQDLTATLRQTLLQLFIRGNPFRGSAGATNTAQKLVKILLQLEELQALVIYGSPYVYQQFRELLPEALPSIFTYAQTPLAQAVALETLFSS
ncbi:MAG: beta-glucosidase [Coleofasciculaceae cyanobacterium SM2_1_6]|nr:beta-glucosidase [Coleofasciculaceae cyanobacterium SM2_1_6]